MKNLAVLFLFTLLGFQLSFSQLNSTSGLFNHNGLFSNNFSSDKFSSGLEIGSSFTSFSNNFSALSSYINPTMNFKVNPKLEFKTGLFIVNSSLLNTPAFAQKSPGVNNFGNMMTYFYAQTQYNINEKLKITGQVLYGNNKADLFGNYSNSRNINYSYSLSADYKINDLFQIGIQLRKNQFNSPYLGNQQGYSAFGNQQYNPLGFSNYSNNW